MILSKSQIEGLLAGSTKGKWSVLAYKGKLYVVYDTENWAGDRETLATCVKRKDADFMSSAPDIAETALFYAEKVERIKNRVGILRQLLNEDRIDNPRKMIDNDYIIKILEIE